jgi:hypothetical protein
MKLETAIVIAKGACVLGAAFCFTLASGLSQWSNETATPSTIQWIIILACSVASGLTSFGAFLSSSFGNFLKNRSGIDINGQTQTTQTTKPNEP